MIWPLINRELIDVMKVIPLLSVLIFSAVSVAVADAAAEREATLISEFEVAAYGTLGANLDELASQVAEGEGEIAVNFEAIELRDRRLPRMKLRRVYLRDLLVALGQLTGTTITISEKGIAVVDEVGRRASIAQVELQGGGRAKLTPLSGEESMMQVYDVTDLLTQTDSGQSGSSRIVRLMESKLTEHARFRRDDLEKKPFTVEYNRVTGIIVLRAPVAYHLTAENFFADLRQTANIQSKPAKVGQGAEELAVAVVEEEEGAKEESEMDAVLEKIETAALLRALREMNRKLDLLEERSREQDVRIDELHRRLKDQDESKASE